MRVWRNSLEVRGERMERKERDLWGQTPSEQDAADHPEQVRRVYGAGYPVLPQRRK